MQTPTSAEVSPSEGRRSTGRKSSGVKRSSTDPSPPFLSPMRNCHSMPSESQLLSRYEQHHNANACQFCVWEAIAVCLPMPALRANSCYWLAEGGLSCFLLMANHPSQDPVFVGARNCSAACSHPQLHAHNLAVSQAQPFHDRGFCRGCIDSDAGSA